MPREQYEIHWQDYYEILQVHPKAESAIISAAYRKLARVDTQEHWDILGLELEAQEQCRQWLIDTMLPSIQGKITAAIPSRRHYGKCWIGSQYA